MLLLIIFGIILAIGIILIVKYKDEWLCDGPYAVGLILTWTFGIFIVIALGIIILVHCGTDEQIEYYRIGRESLIKRMEVSDSNYEDVSKSDVISDVAKWNQKIVRARYWSNNLLTNWFYSQKVVDSLELIDLDKFGGDDK